MTRHIGILGAGQLGRMLALAAYPLDVQLHFFDPAPASPAGQLGPQTQASYEDLQALDSFASGVELCSFEFENVPTSAVARIASKIPVHPSEKALAIAQDRIQEKSLCVSLGIPTPRFRAIDSESELNSALAEIGLPAVLKTRRMGYDGKGQAVLRPGEDALVAFKNLGEKGLILESFVPFERELSIIAARSTSGEIVFYPIVQNIHRGGILRETIAPAPDVDASLERRAQEIIRKLVSELDYVGALAVELFQHDGELFFNEMAPRVHNSGHWSIEGAETSQFENHVRAICGMPLGSTALRSHNIMFNFIGRVPDVSTLLAVPGCHVHLYGKEPRTARKLGHCTVCAESSSQLAERAARVRSLLCDDG